MLGQSQGHLGHARGQHRAAGLLQPVRFCPGVTVPQATQPSPGPRLLGTPRRTLWGGSSRQSGQTLALKPDASRFRSWASSAPCVARTDDLIPPGRSRLYSGEIAPSVPGNTHLANVHRASHGRCPFRRRRLCRLPAAWASQPGPPAQEAGLRVPLEAAVGAAGGSRLRLLSQGRTASED